MSRTVASRRFRAGDGSEVRLAIDAPEEVGADEWRAGVRLEGVPGESTTYAHGADSLQAYALALRMAEARLRAVQRRHGLTWLDHGEPIADLML